MRAQHFPTLCIILHCYRLINTAPRLTGEGVNTKKGRLSLSEEVPGGLWWRRVLLPSGVQQMLRLLINPFGLTVWNLATHLYGNSSVQGWRGNDGCSEREGDEQGSKRRERAAQKHGTVAGCDGLLFLSFKQMLHFLWRFFECFGYSESAVDGT